MVINSTQFNPILFIEQTPCPRNSSGLISGARHLSLDIFKRKLDWLSHADHIEYGEMGANATVARHLNRDIVLPCRMKRHGINSLLSIFVNIESL
jgi:hypothetical protein